MIYRDVTYDDLDLELDGRLYHDNVEQRDRDLDRDLDAAVAQRTAVRLGYGQVVDRPCRTAGRGGAVAPVAWLVGYADAVWSRVRSRWSLAVTG